MYSRRFRDISWVLALAFVGCLPTSLIAQVAASQGRGNMNAPAPKWDIFVGYSMLDPKGTFYPIQPDGSVLPVSFKVEKTGTIEAATYYFTRNVGFQAESAQHDLFTNTGFAGTGSSNSGILTLESGLVYRWPGMHFTPFVHGYAGGAYIDGPDHEPYTWGPIAGGGGGLDWYFGCHIGVRLFQADYEYLHANSGPSHGTLAAHDFTWGDDEDINAIRLSAGLVFRGASVWSPAGGCGGLPAPALACIATPSVIFPGEPVTVTATASGLNPKKTETYSWSGTAASVNGNVATVDTTSLAPGTYTVQARVIEGPKADESADCQASFTVMPWEPPTLSCVAGPTTINADQTSTITLSGKSPQNRPLTYTCTSTAGNVALQGDSWVFSPSGAPAGPVTINCQVADDKGKTADCNTSVTIQPPPIVIPLPVPQCKISFSNDSKRPTRVDNEAKACLDNIAIALQQHPDETLVVVGEATSSEGQSATGVAAQRAVNTKAYLTTEKGIDPSRITVVVGSDAAKGVENYEVPPGAVFTANVLGTTPVDESVVKPQERKPLPMRSHGHKQRPGKTAAANAPAKPKDAAKKPATTPKAAATTKKPVQAKKKPAGSAAPAQGSTGP